MRMDPYEVLNVPRSANKEEVDKAYNNLRKIYRTDFTGNESEKKWNEEKYAELTGAYLKILKNIRLKSEIEQNIKISGQIEIKKDPLEEQYYGKETRGSKYFAGGEGGSYADYKEIDTNDEYKIYKYLDKQNESEDDVLCENKDKVRFHGNIRNYMDFSGYTISKLGINESWYKNAMKSLEAGDYEGAIIILKRIDTRTALWYYLEALSYGGLGEITKAKENAITAYNMEQDNTQFWSFLKFIDSFSENHSAVRKNSTDRFINRRKMNMVFTIVVVIVVLIFLIK